MEQKDLQILADIHNALLNVETKGENTIIIAQCLMRLKSFVEDKSKELNNKQEEE